MIGNRLKMLATLAVSTAQLLNLKLGLGSCLRQIRVDKDAVTNSGIGKLAQTFCSLHNCLRLITKSDVDKMTRLSGS
jgi:hypothetical protein